MAVIPRNPNPNLGFRGNPDGNPVGEQRRTLADYGVYAAPVHRALLHYGFRSDVALYGSDRLLMSYINHGRPVVVWITYGLRTEQPRLAQANGVQFILVPFEHTVLVTGYDAAHVFANDPFTGKRVRYLWANFNRAWGYFGDMALAMEPCAAPGTVTDLRLTALTPAAMTWTWRAAANAAGYDVTVTEHETKDTVVFQGKVTTPTFTLSAPSLKAAYDMSVEAVSACGGTSPPSRLWVQIPTPLATPAQTNTPTPVEGTLTPGPIGTPTASPPRHTRRTVTPGPSSRTTATATAILPTQPAAVATSTP